MKTVFSAVATAALLTVLGAPAHAQTFENIMTDLGLQKKKEQFINYGERAPLVLPPTYDQLPPPEDSKGLTAANAQWPKDPDAARRAQELADEEIPDQFKRKYTENAAEEIYAINRQERRVIGQPQGQDYVPASARENQLLSPQELRAAKKVKKEDPTVFVQEPERKRITDPPVGYRTPSPNQPYVPGEVDENGKPKQGLLSKLNPFK
ncbi:hypothetical protein [Terrihabitans rhizophilus]|uniref:DUF3035 domain-containing protein n=1 Tax=Terrihabitans rhizophilus TaxID=3092662 RepID=A0ABU4RS53_9HYPH|nr:hypothetical protein [Terrihabitans sp. PJ23]MDX6806904.1 hypothetical protein [Terrihabitans sp. PJ23]